MAEVRVTAREMVLFLRIAGNYIFDESKHMQYHTLLYTTLTWSIEMARHSDVYLPTRMRTLSLAS